MTSPHSQPSPQAEHDDDAGDEDLTLRTDSHEWLENAGEDRGRPAQVDERMHESPPLP
jgi:hypothetical protein